MENQDFVRILAISGSLRRASSNNALVAAVARLAPHMVEVSIYRELEMLPPFNPDLDRDEAPVAVSRFRAALQSCDAVLISSPEYAHGVPGVLKNALDWVVGSGELLDKPVALINASGRAQHAWTSLAETLAVMSAHVIPEASITVSIQGSTLDANGIVGDAELAAVLKAAIETLAFAAHRTARCVVAVLRRHCGCRNACFSSSSQYWFNLRGTERESYELGRVVFGYVTEGAAERLRKTK